LPDGVITPPTLLATETLVCAGMTKGPAGPSLNGSSVSGFAVAAKTQGITQVPGDALHAAVIGPVRRRTTCPFESDTVKIIAGVSSSSSAESSERLGIAVIGAFFSAS